MISLVLIQYEFTLVSSSILTILSFIGNSLVIYILTRTEFRNIALFRFLTASAVFDIIATMFVWMIIFQETFGINKTDLNCQIFIYFSDVTLTTSIWIVAYTGIDRVMSVKFPKKYLFRNKFTFQIFIVSIIFFGKLLVNIKNFYTNGLVLISQTNKTVCTRTNYELNVYSDLIGFIYNQLVPTLVTTITIIATFYYLSVLKKKLKKEQKKERQFLTAFLSISLFYIITQVPFYIYIIYCDFSNTNATQSLFFNILLFLTNIYGTFGCLVLYFSNSLFRKHFKTLICLEKKKSDVK